MLSGASHVHKGDLQPNSFIFNFCLALQELMFRTNASRLQLLFVFPVDKTQCLKIIFMLKRWPNIRAMVWQCVYFQGSD